MSFSPQNLPPVRPPVTPPLPPPRTTFSTPPPLEPPAPVVPPAPAAKKGLPAATRDALLNEVVLVAGAIVAGGEAVLATLPPSGTLTTAGQVILPMIGAAIARLHVTPTG